MKSSVLWVWLALSLSACGFQLRGEVRVPAELSPLFIASEGADSVAAAVRERLREQGVALSPAAAKAKLIVTLRNERAERRVLSVSAVSGKLEEVELNYRVEMSARKADGEAWMPPQTFSLVRDFTFNELAVLAKDAEEQVLRQELREDLIAQVLRRLDFMLSRQAQR